MAVSFKGAHFPKDIILMGVRWYVAYPLSYRHIEELMEERRVEVDHSTIQRWVVKYSPPLEELSSVGFSLRLLWAAVGRHGADRQQSRDCSATVLEVCLPPAGADPDRERPG
jgi:hypothetical protein